MATQKITMPAPDHSPPAAVTSTPMAGLNASAVRTQVAVRGVVASVLAGLLLAISGCAQYKEALTAQPCQLLAKASVPITLHRGRVIVSASLNGRPVRMMVDTGAGISTIAPHIAESLGPGYNRGKLIHINGMGGRSEAQHPFKVKTIQMGSSRWLNFEVMVIAPGYAGEGDDPEAVAGIIGTDLLRWYDVEFDFPNSQMTFYSASNCKADFLPWTKPYQVLRSSRNRQDLFFIPVELNGRTLRALVDTGANATHVIRRAALAAGADPAVLELGLKTSSVGVLGIKSTSWLYGFDTLVIAGNSIRKPRILVTDDNTLTDMDMLLGMDFWLRHKLWVSYGSSQLFIQYVPPQQGNFPRTPLSTQ